MPEYDTKEFLDAKTSNKLVEGPYVVKRVNAITDLLNEKASKSAMAIFAVQFPNSSAAKKDGKVQQPFAPHERRLAVRDAMLEYTPQAIPIPKSVNFSCVEKTVSAVSQFGS